MNNPAVDLFAANAHETFAKGFWVRYGQIVRRARRAQRLTLTQLASSTGLTDSVISRVEKANYKHKPHPRTLFELSEALGVPNPEVS
jgi:transcriptional regulator with XRE-family HTH domain